MWRVFKLAARAAVWRATPDAPLVGLPTLFGWIFVLAALRIAIQYVDAGSLRPSINPYGFNAVVAWLAIELAIAVLFIRPPGRVTALSAMLVLFALAESLVTSINVAAPRLASAAIANSLSNNAAVMAACFAAETVWWIGAMVCVVRSFRPQPRLRLAGRVTALWAAVIVAYALVPHAPVFLGPDFDIRNANLWEYLSARYGTSGGGGPAASAEIARIEKAQPALLDAEVAQLAPQRKGVTDVYVLGIAGWADQDVFLKELDGALTSLAGVLPTKDRMIRLINHRETIESIPLANPQNFTASVHAIGNVMDKNEDVLVLLMTSHGDQNGVALQLPGRRPTELTPQQVATALESEGIKNRVVIVSACFSGTFVPPLANDDTIVMTASDEKNTSFGCAPERDWTYFGDALFRQSLLPGTDFQHAFDHARILIQGWEMLDRVPPSNPQGQFGPALVAKLAPLFASPQAGGQ